jgi:ubiquinone/menaquinone biosynthesis C-methylase UbiE
LALPGGLERSLALLDPARRPGAAPVADGYLDLMRDGPAPAPTGMTQRFMLTGAVPVIYERYWRPALGRIAKGPLGPSMSEERRIVRLLLGLGPGDGVLDLACGPGNFTREFAKLVGRTGIAVGVDASPTMLGRAVAETPAARSAKGNVAYVRADATRLPFRDASFDAVCCFAALHLFTDPFGALDEMGRILTPGGRVAILTSCRTRTPAARAWDGFVGARLGMRMFERDEITEALTERGFGTVKRRISGLAQFVGGRKGR